MYASVGEVEEFKVLVPPSEYNHPCPNEVAPVPPFETPMVFALQVPVVTVPKVMRFVEPAQVESAVFSTLFNASVDFKLAVDVPESDPVPLA
jgi:hypothetical protein